MAMLLLEVLPHTRRNRAAADVMAVWQGFSVRRDVAVGDRVNGELGKG